MSATILIPTRGRPAYLEVTLGSVVPQARAAGAEVVVIDDGDDPATGHVARRHAVRLLDVGPGAGANAARNAGVAATDGDLVILLDDDVDAPNGWLAALLDGVATAPDHDAFGGPIRAAIEPPVRSCGREGAPITTLDLGRVDRDAELVWSANMAIRRAALTRVGPFDETIRGRGEEEDWERRLVATGGRIRYVAAAGVAHRRVGPDARLRSLAAADYVLGRSARRYDARKRTAPTLAAELRTLAGCLTHVVRFRCATMVAAAAHSAGRIREALAGTRS